MHPHDLLGTTFDCSCGRTHTVPVKTILYTQDALDHLDNTLAQYAPKKRLVLLADERTHTIAAATAQQNLQAAGWTIQTIIIPDTTHGSPVCDDITHDQLAQQISPADIFLAVGTGVVNDLTKWLAHDCDRPYAVIATAATMNGFTAANVAPTIKGVKSITFARAPVAVFAVPSIIASAPFELTTAGFGDVIAKPISTADWIMNHLFLDEYFCSTCADMITTLEPSYFDNPHDVKARQPAAIESLLMALMYSGIAMTVVGTSAPASGGEHMLSHTLDMISTVDNIPHDLHGRQVGLGTLFAAALYERILAIESPQPTLLPEHTDRQFWKHLADLVADQYEQKKPLLQTIHRKLAEPDVWTTFRQTVRPHLRSPREIKNCLKTAGAAHCLNDISCPRPRLRATVRHMHEIRKRPTVVDLAWLLGILPNQADDLIDHWLTP